MDSFESDESEEPPAADPPLDPRLGPAGFAAAACALAMRMQPKEEVPHLLNAY